MFPKTFQTLPDIPSGISLKEWFDVFVVEPDEATNLCINPSFEVNTTGWGAISGGTLARDITYQRFGANSLKYTPTSTTTDGVTYSQGYSATVSLPYVFSVHFKGSPGKPYRIFFADTSNNSIGTPYTFIATGDWQRIVVYFVETSTTTRRICIAKNSHANTDPFWVDGILLAQSDHDSLYFDGDSEGFYSVTDFQWNGQIHGSTSFRSALTQASGRLRAFSDYGFYIEAILGLGITPLTNVTTPTRIAGGSIYQRTIFSDRGFSIVGKFQGKNNFDLLRKRKALISLFSKPAHGNNQEIVLLFRTKEGCGAPPNKDFFVRCLYEPSGGDIVNPFGISESFNFKIVSNYNGFSYDAAVNLSGTLSISTANRSLMRRQGIWQTMGTGMNGTVRAIAVDHLNNRVYFGGAFTTANGVTVNGICYWDGNTFVAMGSGIAGGEATVFSIAIAPNGDVWIGGGFTTVNGVAGNNYIARWNYASSTWTAFGAISATSAVSGFVRIHVIRIKPTNGNVYFGGDFVDFNGDGNQDFVSSYIGGSFTAVPGSSSLAAIPQGPHCMKFTESGIMYLGVRWTTDGRLYSFDGSSWTSLGACTGSGQRGVDAVEILPDGRVFVGGKYATIGGVTARNATIWDGVTFLPMGSGVGTSDSEAIMSSALLSDNSILAGGIFSSAGGVSLLEGLARWDGYTWSPYDVDLPGSPTSLYVIEWNDSIYIGFDTSGTATVPGSTTFSLEASQKIRPILIIDGPSSGSMIVRWIENTYSRKLLYLNLTIQAGERITLDFRPGNVHTESSWRGVINLPTLPTSDLLEFFFTPGQNKISAWITGGTPTSFYAQWKVVYSSIDDVII